MGSFPLQLFPGYFSLYPHRQYHQLNSLSITNNFNNNNNNLNRGKPLLQYLLFAVCRLINQTLSLWSKNIPYVWRRTSAISSSTSNFMYVSYVAGIITVVRYSERRTLFDYCFRHAWKQTFCTQRRINKGLKINTCTFQNKNTVFRHVCAYGTGTRSKIDTLYNNTLKSVFNDRRSF